MRDLIIIHPGTGTVIPLSDTVLLADRADVEDDITTDIDATRLETYGLPLDNANMGRLFFGDDV